MSSKDPEKELFEETNKVDSKSEDEIIHSEEAIEEKPEESKKTKKNKRSKIEVQLEEIQEELESYKDKYYRTLAEMENYKKRTNNELIKERKYSSQNLADKLIDSIEVFTQALNIKTEDKQMQNFLYGFRMIKDMMFNALKDEGVSVIETNIGDMFDPNIHEAMETEYHADQPEHCILKVSKTGYKFKDRILRPTFVVINVKENKDSEEHESENNEINNNESIEKGKEE